jgi:hypothetical protein
MNPFETQFAALQADFPGAKSIPFDDGSYCVVIPNFSLPAGWSAKEVTARFIAPVGYPLSKPDCFWCDHGLTLATGIGAQNTGSNPLPGEPAPLLWFSWHISSWSPNADTLRTYVRVIKNRFLELR